MLALFRRSQKIWLWILIVVVVATFVPWGARTGYNMASGGTRVVGTYNQKDVTDDQLRRAVRGATITLYLQGVKPEQMNNPQELEMEGWRRLIQVTEAKRYGIAVSQQEIENAVRRTFFNGAEIDQDAYRGIVIQLGGQDMTPREFEDHFRETIMIEKLRQYISQTVAVTDEDVRQAYETERTLIKLAYIPFYNSNFFSAQPISTNEIADYYNTNQNEFKVPPQANILLAMVHAKPEAVVIDPADVQDYYDNNRGKYAITNEPAASLSNDTEEAEAEYTPFATVSNDIVRMLAKQKADDVAFDLTEQLSFAMADKLATTVEEREKLFRSGAEKLGISTLDTGLLTLNDNLPGITNSYELVRSAFSMKQGDVTDVMTIPGVGQALLFLKERRDEFLPDLTNCADKVAVEIRRQRALTSTRESADALRRKVDGMKIGFTNAIAQLKVPVRTTLPIDRYTGIADVSCPAEIVSRLFAYPVGVSVVVPFPEGYMLVCPIEILDPDYELMAAEVGSLRDRLSRQDMGLLYQQWFNIAAQKLQRKGSLAETTAAQPDGDPEGNPDLN